MFQRRRNSGGYGRSRGRTSSRGRSSGRSRYGTHGASQYGSRSGRGTRRRYYYAGRRY